MARPDGLAVAVIPAGAVALVGAAVNHAMPDSYTASTVNGAGDPFVFT